jgi:hypothetical protein
MLRGMLMSEVAALKRDVAKQQPESVFESPLDIVNEVLLTKGEKLATLTRWRLNILGELDASSEGMATRGYTGRQLTVLEEIGQAEARLKDAPHKDTVGGAAP